MRTIIKDESLYSIDDALRIYLSAINYTPRIREIHVKDSYGYISAENVKAPIDYPPFSRSNVDGYAIRSSCTPGELEIVERIGIGEFKEINLTECKAVEVDTGAIIPMGADAVVKIEEVEIKDGKIKINKKVNFGYNIGWLGSDIPKGFTVLRRGEKISHEKIALLASLGVDKIKVYDKLKIYLIATGDELIEPGNPLKPGKIYESNLHYLISRLKNEYEIVGSILLSDNIDKIKEEINKATLVADVIIITGGTSAGEKDYVHRAIRELGSIIIHGIKIKPGKPTILGVINNKVVIGLPGNVVSSVVVFDNIVTKILDNLYPRRKEELELGNIKARVVLPVRADKNRDTLIPVYLFKGLEGSYYALPVKFDSYMIGTFALTEGYVMLKAGQSVDEGGEVEVKVKRFDNSISIIGEEDKGFLDLDTKNVLLGSLPAIKAIEYKFGDIAIVSSLYSKVDYYDKIVKRDIVVNGEGEEIGYDDWVGMSKIVKNPVIKLKSPSSIYSLVGKAKVYAPESYIKGEKVIKEELYVIGITDRGKKFISNLTI